MRGSAELLVGVVSDDAFFDGLQVMLLGLPGERADPLEHVVHDNPEASNVAFLIVLPGENFRGHVLNRSAALLQLVLALFVVFAGETPVDQFDRGDLRALFGLLQDQDVLRLYVAVHDALAVGVVDRFHDLVEDLLGVLFGEHFPLYYFGEKVA